MPAHLTPTKQYRRLEGEEVLDQAALILWTLFEPGRPRIRVSIQIAEQFLHADLRSAECERVRQTGRLSLRQRHRLEQLLLSKRAHRVAAHAGVGNEQRRGSARGLGHARRTPADKDTANTVMFLAVDAFVAAISAISRDETFKQAPETAPLIRGVLSEGDRKEALDDAHGFLRVLLAATERPTRKSTPGPRPAIEVTLPMYWAISAEVGAETGEQPPAVLAIAAKIVERYGSRRSMSREDQRRQVQAVRSQINRLRAKARQ